MRILQVGTTYIYCRSTDAIQRTLFYFFHLHILDTWPGHCCCLVRVCVDLIFSCRKFLFVESNAKMMALKTEKVNRILNWHHATVSHFHWFFFFFCDSAVNFYVRKEFSSVGEPNEFLFQLNSTCFHQMRISSNYYLLSALDIWVIPSQMSETERLISFVAVSCSFREEKT